MGLEAQARQVIGYDIESLTMQKSTLLQISTPEVCS